MRGALSSLHHMRFLCVNSGSFSLVFVLFPAPGTKKKTERKKVWFT